MIESDYPKQIFLMNQSIGLKDVWFGLSIEIPVLMQLNVQFADGWVFEGAVRQ